MFKYLIIGALVLVIGEMAYITYRVKTRTIPENIVRAPDSRLRTVAKPVESFDEEVLQIAQELEATIRSVDIRGNVFGLGLAANQIGHDKRMIALKQSYGTYHIMINPEIVRQSWKMPWTEQCLSTSGQHRLARFMNVHVEYQDIYGTRHERILFGPKAAVLQQEIDHLNGKLITDNQ